MISNFFKIQLSHIKYITKIHITIEQAHKINYLEAYITFKIVYKA